MYPKPRSHYVIKEACVDDLQGLMRPPEGVAFSAQGEGSPVVLEPVRMNPVLIAARTLWKLCGIHVAVQIERKALGSVPGGRLLVMLT